MDDAFRLDRTRFAAEELDSEVVLIDILEGTYFALGGATAEIWGPLTSGHAPSAIAAALAERHGAPLAAVLGEVDALVARLFSEEGVLTRAEPSTDALDLGPGPAEPGLRPFLVEKYMDLQDILTLDPIHDVDPETGWPAR